jgi:NAD(P)-dependent dehydrogenase (short-subunit alcohol dehydrogenase family)
MSTYDFSGRVALVTGAGSGIGAEIAHGLAASGAFVVVTDRRLDRVEATVAAWGEDERGRSSVRALDVTDRATFGAVVASVTSEHGRVDLLVNNAGVVAVPKPLAEVSDEEWDRIFGVNAKGVFNGLACVLPQMMARGSGVVLNLGSVSAVKQVPGLGVYGASKVAVTALTRAAALEAGPSGVRVNELQPGPTLTPMVTGRPGQPTGAEEAFAAQVPLGRVSTPAEQAAAALFLLSDAASYVNGATLLVDGGLAWT